ncbi:hypothetical protein pb186bvf_010051 [Paramecium bursaria]
MQNNPNNPKFESLRLPSFISQQIVVDQPVIGSGANAIRKIFYQQRFDNFENHHLEIFKEKIQQLQDYNPAYHRDEFLLRFLYANKFDQQKSYDHLGACLAINYREGYFKLNDEIENFYRKGCAYIGGRTKDYKPTIVLNTTLIDNFKIVEQALSILCYIVEEYMFERGKVESWIVILKTQDQSVFKLPLDILNQLVSTLQILYPCTLEALYIIQPSLSLNIQWSRIEEFIKGETIPKITFLNKNQLDLLLNRFEPDQLEKALGGEKIINEYWPPQPWKSYQQIQIQQIQEPIQQNNMFQDVPVAYEPILPQSEIIVPMQNQFIFQSEPQYLQAPYEQPQEEVKKRCVCIKCNKEIDEANKLREKSKVNGLPKSLVIKPPPKPNDNIKEIQVQTDPIEIYPQNPDETYVSYHQKYDNIADSYLDQTILPKQEPKQEQKQEPKEEQKQDEIKKPIKEDSVIEKAQKPAFQNPYFNPQQSQQMEKPNFRQQQSYHPSLQSYQQPIFQPQTQQSLQSYQPQLQQPIYEYQPFNAQNYNYKPQWQASQAPAQNNFQSPVSNNYQQSPQFQVVSAKVEEYDIKQTMNGNIKRYDFSEWDKYNSDGSAYVPQEIQSYKKNYDTYQPYDYKPSVPNYQQNPSVSPYQQTPPIQPNYQQNPSVQPYQQTPPIQPNYQNPSVQPYQQTQPIQPYQQTQVLDLKPSYIPHDQFDMPSRPKEYVPEYRPTEFNPELYRPSDKDSVQQFQYYRPTDPEYLRQYQSYEDRPTDTKYPETAKTQPPQQVNQLYAQKPGQQACQIF